MTTFLECMKLMSSILWCSLVAKLDQYTHFSFSKTVLLALAVEDLVFVSFFLGEIVRCHSMLCRVSVSKR